MSPLARLRFAPTGGHLAIEWDEWSDGPTTSVTVISHVGQTFTTDVNLLVGTTTVTASNVKSVSSTTTADHHLVCASEYNVIFFESSVPAIPTFFPRLGGSNPFDTLTSQAASFDPSIFMLSSAATSRRPTFCCCWV